MISAIQWLLNNWRLSIYSIVGITFISLAVWLGHLRQENRKFQNDIQQFQQTETTMQAQLKATQVQAQKTITALAVQRQQTRLRTVKIQKIQEGIRHATPQDDGVVAPVLRTVLDQLRQPEPHNID